MHDPYGELNEDQSNTICCVYVSSLSLSTVQGPYSSHPLLNGIHFLHLRLPISLSVFQAQCECECVCI